MAKLIVMFRYKSDAQTWLENAKKNPRVKGGNVFRMGTYRAMIYGDITPNDVGELRQGKIYKYEA